MYYILYLSAATQLPGEPELTGILSASRANNSLKNITGVLLYGEGNFIQVLEGDEAAVRETYGKISEDSRHKGITLITSGQIKDRNFPEWSMGFKSMNSAILSEFDGYINPSIQEINRKKDPALPIKLLKSFVRTNRLGN